MSIALWWWERKSKKNSNHLPWEILCIEIKLDQWLAETVSVCLVETIHKCLCVSSPKIDNENWQHKWSLQVLQNTIK